jgi:hypothetical protein
VLTQGGRMVAVLNIIVVKLCSYRGKLKLVELAGYAANAALGDPRLRHLI